MARGPGACSPRAPSAARVRFLPGAAGCIHVVPAHAAAAAAAARGLHRTAALSRSLRAVCNRWLGGAIRSLAQLLQPGIARAELGGAEHARAVGRVAAHRAARGGASSLAAQGGVSHALWGPAGRGNVNTLAPIIGLARHSALHRYARWAVIRSAASAEAGLSAAARTVAATAPGGHGRATWPANRADKPAGGGCGSEWRWGERRELSPGSRDGGGYGAGPEGGSRCEGRRRWHRADDLANARRGRASPRRQGPRPSSKRQATAGSGQQQAGPGRAPHASPQGGYQASSKGGYQASSDGGYQARRSA